MTKKDYELLVQMMRIGNRAVCAAQKENHRLGLANVYCQDGQIYFQLPDKTITQEVPDNLKA